MTNLIEQYEQKQIERIAGDKTFPEFQAGDTLRVHVRIVEGKNERIQVFEGLCIARKNRGVNSSFTVRKISHGEGVERVFPLYSPRVEKVEVVRRGVVRRAKLYYMRELTGKAARIQEKREVVSKTANDSKGAKPAAEAKADSKPAEKTAEASENAEAKE
jgi:large subunit ribosomal protein L19